MRNVLCETLIASAADPKFVFLTGDLGFGALEPLSTAAGSRFINAGVAEQNMVTVAAGMARSGLTPWVYSIAPFIYARPFEQIRNDICLHDLPVKLLGNGGGYAYGPMGCTHHALEDYGILLTLPNMRVYVPAFAADVPIIIGTLSRLDHPAYLRLGRCELPPGTALPPYTAWRKLLEGDGPVLLVVGPLAGGILREAALLESNVRPNMWVLSELPLKAESIPFQFILELRNAGHLIVAEEHTEHGSVGQSITHIMALIGEPIPRFTHRCARGYVSGTYGSQQFHRKECGLDPVSIASLFKA